MTFCPNIDIYILTFAQSQSRAEVALALSMPREEVKKVDGGRNRAVVGGFLSSLPIAVGILAGAVMRSVVKAEALCFALVIAISIPGGIFSHSLLTRYLRKQDSEE